MCIPRGLKCGSLRLPTLSPWSGGIEITLNLNNFSISEGIPTWRLLSFLWESLLLQFLCRYCGKISHPWGAVLLRFWATPGVSPWVSVSNNDTDVISLEAITPLTWTAFATSPWKNWRCVWKKILGRKWRRWGTGFSRKFQAGAKLLLWGSFGTWSLAPATMIEVLPFGRWCLRQLQGGRAGTATSTEALTIIEKKLRYNQLSLRSRPFDFSGGLWVILEKKNPADWFDRGKNRARKYEKYRNVSRPIIQGKMLHRYMSGKKFRSYSVHITHTPLQKSNGRVLYWHPENTNSSRDEIFKAPCPVFSPFIWPSLIRRTLSLKRTPRVGPWRWSGSREL